MFADPQYFGEAYFPGPYFPPLAGGVVVVTGDPVRADARDVSRVSAEACYVGLVRAGARYVSSVRAEGRAD